MKSFMRVAMVLSSVSALISTAALPASALEKGGSDIGNGGDVIVLPDGSKALADPYILRPADHGIRFSDFNPAIREEIELVGRLLVRLGAAVDASVPASSALPASPKGRKDAIMLMQRGHWLSRASQARFIVESVAHKLVEYHFVDKLPESCRSADDVGTIPGGASDVLGACNEGDVVWFRKDLFSAMPLKNADPSDPREQVKWIIHERLHAINVGDNPHFFIADITDGIDVLLDLHRDQTTGRRPVPSQGQIAKIETLISRIASFKGLTVNGEREEQFLTDWMVWPNGGGLVHVRAQASPHAYVGVGSLLGEGGRMDHGTALINSACFVASCELSEGASLENSIVAPRASLRTNAPDEAGAQWFRAIFRAGSRVLSSSLAVDLPSDSDAFPLIQVGERALIERSMVSGMTSLLLGEAAVLQSVAMPIHVNDNASTRVEIGAGATLSSLFAPMQVAASPDDALRSLNVPKGAQIDFNSKPICPQARLLPVLSGDVQIRSTGDLVDLCRDPAKPRPPRPDF